MYVPWEVNSIHKLLTVIEIFHVGGRHGSVGKSAVFTPLGMLELVQTPLLPGMSMCAFLY